MSTLHPIDALQTVSREFGAGAADRKLKLLGELEQLIFSEAVSVEKKTLQVLSKIVSDMK